MEHHLNETLNPLSRQTLSPFLFFLFFFFFFLVGLGFGLRPAKQVFYCLSHTSSPFCSGYFGDGVTELFALAGLGITVLPISVSQVSRITGMSTNTQLFFFSFFFWWGDNGI
jgi:hypothetical protein